LGGVAIVSVGRTVAGQIETEAWMSLTMTKEERESFLADVHVGVISVAEDGRGPLTVPIWYAYEPGGEVSVITARMSRKGRLLERAGRFTLCAQTETPPYKYVSVEGSIVAIEVADLERDRRPLAHRYLGAALGDRYSEGTRDAAGNVLVRMRPERRFTVDYSKQYRSS
jgi:nitroimidazol reductase NimA-like FMN-containing flavoprotein (pyridoxamine 5'-phosphate oxidase superfamily)